MSVWMRNLAHALEDRPVVILHGNVRDRYIDDNGRVYENLTAVLTALAEASAITFHEHVFYDAVGHERRVRSAGAPPPIPDAPTGEGELGTTAPTKGPAQRTAPDRVLATWLRELSPAEESRLVVLHYLDKLVPYRTSYSPEEAQLLLWLEKLIENMGQNHRLILVALQDTMVPVELYANSPRTYVLPIPPPGKSDRLAYLGHRLGPDHPRLGFVADLTDGLFLRDLDCIASGIAEAPDHGQREVRRLVNRYRLGEQEDHWGTLSIERLSGALAWFVEEEGVKGQDEPLRKVIDTLCLARAGMSGVASGAGAKPRGVLFFAGPTGVGKTYVAKKLAKFLFSTEEAFLRFDMSEFKEEHTVSKLIGSPPGYVGFERGGMLTNAVREHPFCVILFDEIEKAHPLVMDIYLQILDEGRLTDSRGQTVFFTESVIIFTSNIGTRTSDSRGLPVDERDAIDAIARDASLSEKERKRAVAAHFTEAVERFFMYEISRPELLNRIGNSIAPFNYIQSREVRTDIMRSHLKRIREEFEDRYRAQGHRLEFAEDVAARLVEQHASRIAVFGGRGITNAIEDAVMVPLARALLRAEYEEAREVRFEACVAPETGAVVVRTECGAPHAG